MGKKSGKKLHYSKLSLDEQVEYQRLLRLISWNWHDKAAKSLIRGNFRSMLISGHMSILSTSLGVAFDAMGKYSDRNLLEFLQRMMYKYHCQRISRKFPDVPAWALDVQAG